MAPTYAERRFRAACKLEALTDREIAIILTVRNNREVVELRDAVMWHMHQPDQTGRTVSFPAIVAFFRMRSHATAVIACQRAQRRADLGRRPRSEGVEWIDPGQSARVIPIRMKAPKPAPPAKPVRVPKVLGVEHMQTPLNLDPPDPNAPPKPVRDARLCWTDLDGTEGRSTVLMVEARAHGVAREMNGFRQDGREYFVRIETADSQHARG